MDSQQNRLFWMDIERKKIAEYNICRKDIIWNLEQLSLGCPHFGWVCWKYGLIKSSFSCLDVDSVKGTNNCYQKCNRIVHKNICSLSIPVKTNSLFLTRRRGWTRRFTVYLGPNIGSYKMSRYELDKALERAKRWFSCKLKDQTDVRQLWKGLMYYFPKGEIMEQFKWQWCISPGEA